MNESIKQLTNQSIKSMNKSINAELAIMTEEHDIEQQSAIYLRDQSQFLRNHIDALEREVNEQRHQNQEKQKQQQKENKSRAEEAYRPKL